MPEKVDYNKQVFVQLNNFTEAEVEYIDKIYPTRRSCIPLVREKMNRIFVQFKGIQFDNPASAAKFVDKKSMELALFSRVCIQSKEKLPSALDEAIARIEQLVVVNAAASSLNNQLRFWQVEFQKPFLPHGMVCAPPVRDRALEITQQLEQMKNKTPAELAQLSQGASTHLDYYATRCILDGPSALPPLPPGLQSNPQIPATRRPNPDRPGE